MINYLKLNTREEEILKNATSFTLWSKSTSRKEFPHLGALSEYITIKLDYEKNINFKNTKFLIYAVMNDTDALVGTIN